MNSESIKSLVEPILHYVLPAGGIFIFLGCLYVLLRTGSAHILRRRVWLLVYGKDEPKDATIREFVEDQNSFMAFRYSAGAGVRTLEQAKRLATWLKENNEGVQTVRVAGAYFDMESMSLVPKLPSVNALLWAFCALVVTATLTLEFGAFFFADRAYYQIKRSGHWFSASETDLQGVGPWPWSEHQKLSLNDCQSATIVELPGFTPADHGVLCSFLQASNLKVTVKTTIHQQVGGLIVLGVLFALGFVSTGRMLRRAAVVRQMAKRLEDRKNRPELTLANADNPDRASEKV